MKLKSINKKEDVPRIPIIDNLTSAVISIVILVVAVVVGITLVTQQQSTQTVDTVEYNASESGKTALAVFTSNVGILALALMLFAVLGVIAAFRSN